MKKLLVILTLMLLIVNGCSAEPIDTAKESESEQDQDTQEQGTTEDKELTETIDAEPEEAIDVYAVEAGMKVVVQASKLNVRDSAGLSGNVIATAVQDTVLTVDQIMITEAGFPWYKTNVDGTRGWIAGWFCIGEDDLNNGVGKGLLLSAFDGHLDGMSVTVDDHKDDVIGEFGTAYTEEYFMGGTYLGYENIGFSLYGQGVEGKAVGDIADIFYTGSQKMFGIQVGDSIEKVKETLGYPNREVIYEDFAGEGLYSDGALLMAYYTGSYQVVLNADDKESISFIQLMPLSYFELETISDSTNSETGSEVSSDRVYSLWDLSVGDTLDELTVKSIENDIKGDQGHAYIEFTGRLQLSGQIELDEMYQEPVFICADGIENMVIDMSDSNASESYKAEIPGSFFYFRNSDSLRIYLNSIGEDLSNPYKCMIEVEDPIINVKLNSEGGMSVMFLEELNL